MPNLRTPFGLLLNPSRIQIRTEFMWVLVYYCYWAHVLSFLPIFSLSLLQMLLYLLLSALPSSPITEPRFDYNSLVTEILLTSLLKYSWITFQFLKNAKQPTTQKKCNHHLTPSNPKLLTFYHNYYQDYFLTSKNNPKLNHFFHFPQISHQPNIAKQKSKQNPTKISTIRAW